MKAIIIGDIHSRSTWKIPVFNEEWDEIVFIGDYFDTFENFKPVEQVYNLQEIINMKKEMEEKGKKVTLLIGNHDFHYFPEIGHNGTSGYQAGTAISYEAFLNTNRSEFQMAYSIDNVLFTHAGVGEGWMERIVRGRIVDKLPNYTAAEVAEWVNEIWLNKPLLFNHTGRDGSGDDMGQTPIWIRPRSLMRDSQVMKKEGIIQVVGHTGQSEIDIKGKATGSKYFFIDTLGTSGEYLIIENSVFSTGKTR